jgi:5,10-methylenetetrahydromethanopterin reductase
MSSTCNAAKPSSKRYKQAGVDELALTFRGPAAPQQIAAIGKAIGTFE